MGSDGTAPVIGRPALCLDRTLRVTQASDPGSSEAPVPPLLLIDVDGVISLFGFAPGSPPPGRFAVVDGLPHLLSEQAGRRISRLARSFEAVWCTGWEERAGEHLPHLLALECDPFQHLAFAGSAEDPGRHWKLDAIEAHAGPDRPVAWIDDGHDERTRAWAARRPGPTLLVQTDPAVGLTDEHVSELEAWAGDSAHQRSP